ncbi:2OG-Fe(II) oxygenase [Alteromonadaceae bacterium BrNp21-10]|nr:2OG-Fe(II) oxygenase [Alteromonadaceae bacterium BrNp21-10]
MSTLPTNWKNWVVKNLISGVKSSDILNTLLENGFTFAVARKALGKNLPAELSHQRNADYYRKLSNPQLIGVKGQYNVRFLEQEKAQLFVIEEFLSFPQCDEIINIAKSALKPSEISANSGYEGFRTSTTCDLSIIEHAAVKRLETQIVQCLGIEVGAKEMMQAQHYAVGQQFKKHTDYFEPGSEEYKTHAQQRGQRSWTFMIYLDQSCEGGETEFPHLNLTVTPKKGTALVWNNLCVDGTPNPLTLHQSLPIIAGEKTIVTKWFRDR